METRGGGMQRVIVMGPPGSGKSTVARRLGDRLGLPVFHLDQAFWRPGWIEAPAEAFRAEVERLAALPAWIIEGNYNGTALEARLARADTLVYLDVPSWLSVVRILRRIALTHGRVRPDLAPNCPERLDLAFLRFVWAWNGKGRARGLALAAAFPGRAIVLAGRQPRDVADRL